MDLNSKSTICALVTTYNHQAFIGQCLDSILSQRTHLPFKIVVSDDCSTDNTQSIIREYAQKYPDRIVPILRNKNIGFHSNFISSLEACQADWVAWVEGDDFWCDTMKISKQMGLIDSDPEAVICFGKANSIDLNRIGFIENKIFGPPDNFIKKTYSRNDLLRSNFVHTSTIVFKKEAINPLPEWYSNWHLGDWTLLLVALKKGHAVFLNEVVSTYRIHTGGMWSSTSFEKKFLQQERLITFLISIEDNLKSIRILNFNLASQKIGLFFIYMTERKYSLAFSKIFDVVANFFQTDWDKQLVINYASKALKLVNFIRKK